MPVCTVHVPVAVTPSPVYEKLTVNVDWADAPPAQASRTTAESARTAQRGEQFIEPTTLQYSDFMFRSSYG
jgi:hypothetical protein